jgi:16S rRNA (uracil1498-N3)-methyltransferase
MRISRIYINQALESGQELSLEGERAHYLKTVLRVKKGYRVTLFNGSGLEFSATVLSLGRDTISFEVGDSSAVNKESHLNTHIALGVTRGEKMDFTIQKAVELGVSKITPLLTKNSVVRLDDARRDLKKGHWERVVVSACEQSGRSKLPELEEPTDFSSWIVKQSGLRLLLDPLAQTGLGSIKPQGQDVLFLIGPEGGLAPEERDWAIESGFISVKVGPRVLRAETAALVAISSAQLLWGDLSG